MTQDKSQLFWDASENLKFDLPIGPDSEFFVDTSNARGNATINNLLRALRINPAGMKLMKEPHRKYISFCGHRGCGKTTELKKLRKILSGKDLFFCYLCRYDE